MRSIRIADRITDSTTSVGTARNSLKLLPMAVRKVLSPQMKRKLSSPTNVVGRYGDGETLSTL